MNSSTDIRTIADLRKALEMFPDDCPIGLSVYGHSWFAPCHRGSHGPVRVVRTQLHFSNGTTKDIALLHEGRMPKDGYLHAEVENHGG